MYLSKFMAENMAQNIYKLRRKILSSMTLNFALGNEFDS
jgi:hypothetical protein